MGFFQWRPVCYMYVWYLHVYLIFPLNTSAAYQASLFEPWSVIWRDVVVPKYPLVRPLVMPLVCHWCIPKRYYYIFTIPRFGQVSMISYPYQVSDLISQDIRTADPASDWPIVTLGMVNVVMVWQYCIVLFCSFTGSKENKDSWRWTFTWVYNVCDVFFIKSLIVTSCLSIGRPHKFWEQDLRGKTFWKGVKGIRNLNPFQTIYIPMWTRTYM